MLDPGVTSTHSYIYAYTLAYTLAHICVYMRTYLHANKHACIHTHAHTHARMSPTITPTSGCEWPPRAKTGLTGTFWHEKPRGERHPLGEFVEMTYF